MDTMYILFHVLHGVIVKSQLFDIYIWEKKSQTKRVRDFHLYIKVGSFGIFVQFLIEINRKQSTAKSVSMQIYICRGALKLIRID